MHTQCLAPALSKRQHSQTNLPENGTANFLRMSFGWSPRYTKWNEGFMVYQKQPVCLFNGEQTHRLPNNTGRMIFPPTYIQEDLKATVWPSWNLCEQAYVHTEVSARCIAPDKRPCRGNNDSNGVKVVHMPHTYDGSLSVKLQEWETMSDLRHSVNSVVRLCHAM